VSSALGAEPQVPAMGPSLQLASMALPKLPMLGYVNEHKAVLQAVVEELTALESQVAEAAGPVAPDGSRGLGLAGVFQAASETLEAARSELALALACVQRALQKPLDAEWSVDDRSDDDLEALEEASRLRASAQRRRGKACQPAIHEVRAFVEAARGHQGECQGH